MKINPDEIKLNDQERDELIERVESNQLSPSDRQLLVKLIQCFFWVTFTLRESKISLQRLKNALFGVGGTRRGGSDDDYDDGAGSGGLESANPGEGDGAGADASPASPAPSDSSTTPASETPDSSPSTPDEPADPGGDNKSKKRPGHGRLGAEHYTGASTVACCHDDLAVGERCPQCGRGKLYELPSGVEIRVDGQALLTAIRYEQEKLRCSACGAIFTAPLPPEAGEEKYSARARAVLALSRYYLGLPSHRLEGFQALAGLPVPDATQWDQIEHLAGAIFPLYNCLYELAAQSELFYQDDTTVRILALLGENARLRAQAGEGKVEGRLGMYTTGLVGIQGERRIVLYLSGRSHAGENLSALLEHRDPDLDKPLVMSDALSANELAEEDQVQRCYCLAHGLRQFKDIVFAFPEECERVLHDLGAVFEHEARAQVQELSGEARLHYHQRHSEPILTALKTWLEKQQADKCIEPNSSLGKACQYLLKRWEALTRFLRVPDAPLDSNTVERALKLMIRQRHNSLFFANTYSAQIASALTSVIATAAEAGVNVLDYLVALQDNAAAVMANPERWLPWNYAQVEG